MITIKDIKNATMYIDSVDVGEYGALVEDFTVGGTSITNDIFQGRNRTNFNLIAASFAMRSINVNLFYAAETRRRITQLKSKIDSLLFGKVELYLPDGFYYTAVAKTFGDLSIIGQEDNRVIGQCAYQFEGIRHSALETVEGNTLLCSSTVPYTDCILTCTASDDYDELTIGTVTITDVSEGDVLVVDGINCRILQNDEPCEGNMSFTQFPYLVPGANTFECDETLTIEYYPTYI